MEIPVEEYPKILKYTFLLLLKAAKIIQNRESPRIYHSQGDVMTKCNVES